MGLFNWLFSKKNEEAANAREFFKMLNGYTPVFTSAPQSVYEMEITRAAIHSFAVAASKLKPEITGSAKKHLEKTLQFRPNPIMDTTKFLYRIATILSVNNTAFIIPIENEIGTVTGLYPLLPQQCEVIEAKGVIYLRYTFGNGQRAAIEFDRVGILTGYQYKDEFFGESNAALHPTMELIHSNNQGIVSGVKNSAAIRFIARIAQVLDPDLITDERERFTKENLSADNQSGVIMFDNKYSDIRQVDSKPFTVNAAQMAHINNSVYKYFGTNEKIIMNSYNEDEWNAFYEGKIEPFAIQLSTVLTNMLFTDRELAVGNSVHFTSNRLQYASNQTKTTVSTALFDRGIFSLNDICDIWNRPHVEGGDKRFIRKEYAELNEFGKDPHADSTIERIPTDDNPDGDRQPTDSTP